MSKHNVRVYPTTTPLIAYFACKCGRRFLTRKDRDKHERRQK